MTSVRWTNKSMNWDINQSTFYYSIRHSYISTLNRIRHSMFFALFSKLYTFYGCTYSRYCMNLKFCCILCYCNKSWNFEWKKWHCCCSLWKSQHEPNYCNVFHCRTAHTACKANYKKAVKKWNTSQSWNRLDFFSYFSLFRFYTVCIWRIFLCLQYWVYG